MMIHLILKLVLVFSSAVNGSSAPRKCAKMSIHHLSDDILRFIFIHYIPPSSQINFYKTSSQYFNLLRPFLDPESFLYVHKRPVMRIWKLYSEWDNLMSRGMDASEFRQILLLNDNIQTLSGSLFERPVGPSLPDLPDPFLARLVCPLKLYRFLNKGIDPELIAILVKLWPREMLLDFSYTTDSLDLVKIRGCHQRSEALLDQVFKEQKIPILEVFELQNNSYSDLSLSPDEMDQILKYSCVIPPYKDGGMAALRTYMFSRSNFENFLNLFPPQSVALQFWAMERMLYYGVPIKKILRICKTFLINPAKRLSEATIPLLLRAFSRENETIVMDIIMALNKSIEKPFWGKELDRLVGELGYSDEFLAKIMSALRYR